MNSLRRFSVGQLATYACILEATAPKAGNVFPGRPFANLSFEDFFKAAIAIGPVFELAEQLSLGDLVLQSVQASHYVTQSNANLGIILLLAPLAKAACQTKDLSSSISRVLAETTPEDCRSVYEAIRLVNPGGLGSTAQASIHDSPPEDLLQAMRIAADRDSIAHAYANDFSVLFTEVIPELVGQRQQHNSWEEAIRWAQIALLARIPDTLISRKCGSEISSLVSKKAKDVLATASAKQMLAWADFDHYLRSDGNRLNPGTTADLIAAGLFAAAILPSSAAAHFG